MNININFIIIEYFYTVYDTINILKINISDINIAVPLARNVNKRRFSSQNAVKNTGHRKRLGSLKVN